MCSLPFPDAIERATSRLLNLSFNFERKSFFSWMRDFSGLNSMKSKGSPWAVKSFANDGPSMITFSHSPLWMRPETWDHVPLPVDRRATSSIVFLGVDII